MVLLDLKCMYTFMHVQARDVSCFDQEFTSQLARASVESDASILLSHDFQVIMRTSLYT